MIIDYTNETRRLVYTGRSINIEDIICPVVSVNMAAVNGYGATIGLATATLSKGMTEFENLVTFDIKN